MSEDPSEPVEPTPPSRHTTDSMIPSIYAELRKLAAKKLANESAGQTLSATALGHEVYLRLARTDEPQWDHRGHFYVAAAETMRRILIEHARKRGRIKRGGDRVRVSLSGVHLGTEQDADEILALDEAIRRLEEQDPSTADVVRLRFFAGLSVEETARALKVSERTVKREWSLARAWLYDALRDREGLNGQEGRK